MLFVIVPSAITLILAYYFLPEESFIPDDLYLPLAISMMSNAMF
jgi:hypothetical protein